jgi:hypothetical protein
LNSPEPLTARAALRVIRRALALVQAGAGERDERVALLEASRVVVAAVGAALRALPAARGRRGRPTALSRLRALRRAGRL